MECEVAAFADIVVAANTTRLMSARLVVTNRFNETIPSSIEPDFFES